jgi:hypothetical protein
MIKKLLALSLLAFPLAPAFAVRTDAPRPAPVVTVVPSKPVDPARLAIATRIAAQMLPEGTFAKLMGGMMDGMMNSVMAGVSDIPIRSIAKMAGEDPEKVKALGDARLRDIMLILDPAYQERFQIMARVMGTEMGQAMTRMEPMFRHAMAEVYATRFDNKQLGELEIFFRTPTGASFAQQSMTMQTDPIFMARMQSIVPQIMEAMPAIMKKVEQATASLPKPRKPEELTASDKQRIAELMGTDPMKIK